VSGCLSYWEEGDDVELTVTCFSNSSVDIPTSEGPVNLSWPAIIKTINDDPYEFYKMGGWSFLTGEGEDVSVCSRRGYLNHQLKIMFLPLSLSLSPFSLTGGRRGRVKRRICV
jgi:hypothetical protein